MKDFEQIGLPAEGGEDKPENVEARKSVEGGLEKTAEAEEAMFGEVLEKETNAVLEKIDMEKMQEQLAERGTIDEDAIEKAIKQSGVLGQLKKTGRAISAAVAASIMLGIASFAAPSTAEANDSRPRQTYGSIVFGTHGGQAEGGMWHQDANYGRDRGGWQQDRKHIHRSVHYHHGHHGGVYRHMHKSVHYHGGYQKHGGNDARTIVKRIVGGFLLWSALSGR